MTGHGQPDINRAAHARGDRRADRSPAGSIGGFVGGNGGATPNNPQPDAVAVGTQGFVQAEPSGSGTILPGQSIGGGAGQKGVGGSRGQLVADHESRLGPWIRVGLAEQAGLDEPVAAQGRITEMKTVRTVPNIRAGSLQGPDSPRGAAGPCQSHAAHILPIACGGQAVGHGDVDRSGQSSIGNV